MNGNGTRTLGHGSATSPVVAAAHGFTLIELLVVMAILGLLVAAFLPMLNESSAEAKAKTTIGNLQRLALGCEAYARRHPSVPPDDFKDPENKLQLKGDNGINTGIESLVAFLSQSRADGIDLTDLGERLVNTDGDDNGAVLPTLQKRARLEVADEWGTPIVYFSRTSQLFGFDRPQKVAMPGDGSEVVTVKCKRNEDGLPVGGNKFQLLSAGKDQVFDTEDDLCWPPK